MSPHPVPQNVTGFQFKLVGDITLKQFAYLSGCLILAYLFYKFPLLPTLINLPIAMFLALLGFGLAFVPIEERPLHVWIINFIKSAYSPTQYLWQKKAVKPEFVSFKG